MIEWLVYALIGRVVIFVWQRFKIPIKGEWFEKLHTCSLCSGVWIYSILSVGLEVDIFSELFRQSLVGEISTGIITSYLVWIFEAGWRSQHEVIVI